MVHVVSWTVATEGWCQLWCVCLHSEYLIFFLKEMYKEMKWLKINLLPIFLGIVKLKELLLLWWILWLGYHINSPFFFYCSCQAAELDIKGTEMTTEVLNQVQLGHLRIYHAACLMADAVPEVMCHRTPSGEVKSWLHNKASLVSFVFF